MPSPSSPSASAAATAAKIALAAAAASAASLAGFVAYLHLISRKPLLKHVNYPSPPPPVLGSLAEILGDYDHRYDTMTRWANELGPTWTIAAGVVPRIPIIMTVDPAVVEYILKTNFENYEKGERIHRLLYPLLGDGIFTTDGQQWKWQRKVSSHIFSGRNFRDVVERSIHAGIDKLVAVLTTQAATSTPFDLHKYLHCLTMDTFGHVGLGMDLGVLDQPDTPPAFSRAFDQVLAILNRRFSNPWFTITELVGGQRAALARDMAVVNGFVEKRIREKREQVKEGGEREGRHRDLLDLFIDHDPEITDKQLRDMVLNMFLAGRDTTAQALSWCYYILATRPDVVEKIREEVDQIVGDRIPSYDEVPTLKYTNAVFFETLRLHPSVPGDFKVSVRPDVLPGGIAIPAGTQVTWIPYAMGRMPALWGPDALEFRPERWIDDTGALRRESPFRWTAFNAGPRVCLGQQMATVTGVMVIAALTRRFGFKKAEGAPDVRVGSSLTLVMKEGLVMRAERVG
ncbi:hypothetical protein HDU96_006865 [Phlyctochytrium bullatum]|nr:hypothetical protein HDU96_006865 [Phlyctochytrium bullatum]